MQETQHIQCAVCLNNDGYKASLEVGELHRVIFDKEAEDQDLMRFIGESGEDYAFATERCHMVRLPSRIEEALLAASGM